MKRELSPVEKAQMRDELHRARQMAAHMDRVIDLITTRHVDTTCCRCGRKLQFPARPDQPIEGVRWVCNDCTTGDRPTEKPDTGFGS